MTLEKSKNEFFNSQREPKDDLFLCLRPLLIFGRLIGIIPFQGIHQKQHGSLNYRKKSYAAVNTIIVTIMVAIGMIITFITKFLTTEQQNTTDLAWKIAGPVFYVHGFFLYCYFYIHSELLIKIFVDWTKISLHYAREDTYLFRHANFIVLVTLVSAILENACLHLDYFDVYNHFKKDSEQASPSALETYYHISLPNWEKLFPFREFWAIFAFTLNKLILYTWNFVDILISVLSRAIYFKYKILNEEGESFLLNGGSFHNSGDWKLLALDHMKISNLLAEFEKFTSPLIFASYTINTFYICLQMNLGLTPKDYTNFLKSLYAAWSFAHLSMRIFILSLCAARINEQAHKISHLLRKCPYENYCIEVERLERRLTCGNIGLTGLGCFVITKGFILKILSTIFTFEIVLLQASNPMSTVTTDCNGHFQSANETSRQ